MTTDDTDELRDAVIEAALKWMKSAHNDRDDSRLIGVVRSFEQAQRPLDNGPSKAQAERSEKVCNRCGGPNTMWAAPSPLWNAVMRGGSIDGAWKYGEIICPMCFMELAEAQGIADVWRLDAVQVKVELETVTPSGRAWNPETWLWDSSPLDNGPCKSEMEEAILDYKRWNDDYTAGNYPHVDLVQLAKRIEESRKPVEDPRVEIVREWQDEHDFGIEADHDIKDLLSRLDSVEEQDE